MDKINNQLYQANVELVDKIKWLEEDKKILQKRIREALEILENKRHCEILLGVANDTSTEQVIKILKGRYIKDV